MKTLVKTVMVAVCAGAMLGIAGCGSSESEYESLLDKAVKCEMISEKEAEKSLEKFKKMPPEEQNKEIEEAKAMLKMAESMK